MQALSNVLIQVVGGLVAVYGGAGGVRAARVHDSLAVLESHL
jgi:hypothetical protein